jgi:hypothetical protein
MEFDATTINRHIFSEGAIQMSPAEIQMLNNQAPVPFKASFINSPINSGYMVFLTGYANKLILNEKKLEFGRLLERSINSLRANPRPSDGYLKKRSVDTRVLENRFFYIWYKISNGQVLVYNIEPKKSIQLERDRLEKVSVYKVKKSANGVWRSEGKVNSVSTKYAAVNGQSNNLAKATWLMGAHLDFEFGKNTVTEYTLFHNPSIGGPGDTWESVRDKMGVTTDVTKKFSRLLHDTQKAGNKTKWVAHSQGGLIFSEAVRYHLNGNSSWAMTGGFNGIFRKDKGESLNMHSVAFHSNANNNLRSKALFTRAGVEVLATRANDYDMVNTIVGLNTVNPWRVLGSAIYANHVFSGSLQQSPHTLMHKDFDAWDKQMKNGPGKGRGVMQKGFDTIDKTGRKGIKYINSYFK